MVEKITLSSPLRLPIISLAVESDTLVSFRAMGCLSERDDFAALLAVSVGGRLNDYFLFKGVRARFQTRRDTEGFEVLFVDRQAVLLELPAFDLKVLALLVGRDYQLLGHDGLGSRVGVGGAG